MAIDRGRQIEMAARETAKECRRRGIQQFTKRGGEYTARAQEIFNRAYDEAESVLRWANSWVVYDEEGRVISIHDTKAEAKGKADLHNEDRHPNTMEWFFEKFNKR